MSLQFDAEYYLAQNSDVALAVEQGLLTAEQHWEIYGSKENRNPNADFVTSEYLAANPDVALDGINPLTHFLQYGAAEGRAPSAAYQAVADGFDEADYLAANGDVAAAVAAGDFKSGYEHWVKYGQFEDARPEATVNGGTPVSEVIGSEEPASELTEALGTLADAEQAKADFLEGIDPIDIDFSDATDYDSNSGELDGVDFEAGKATEGQVEAYYTNASGKMEAQTTISGFAGRSASIQDAAIADKQSELEKAVQDETEDAADGMTALLETLESRQKTLAANAEAAGEAADDYDEEVTAFNALNAQQVAKAGVAPTDGQFTFVAGDFVEASVSGGTTTYTVVAEQVDGEWVDSNGDATTIKRLDDLYAEFQALEAANNAVDTAKGAIQDTLEDIVLLESGAYEVESLGGIFTEATGAVDLTQSATVYETEAEADAGAGVKAVYTIDLAAAATAADGDTITIGGVEAYAQSGATGVDAAGIVTALDGGTITIDSVDYDIAKGSNATSVVLTAQSAVDVTADVTVAATGTATEPTKTTFATTKDGEAAGVTEPATIGDAAALADAISTLETFEEERAAFEQARDLNNKLESLNDDIDDATAAIENEPDNEDAPGLGVELATFVDGAQGTSDNEVFLFEDDTDAVAITIGDFGTGGEDKIFFGEGFSLVELGDDEITDNVGDSGAMEIFWEEEGSNLNLYVEAEAFGGNSAGEADLTKIVLTGVSAEDINDDLGAGFLTAGEVA